MFKNIVSLIEKVDDAAADYADGSQTKSMEYGDAPQSGSVPPPSIDVGVNVREGYEATASSSSSSASQHAVIFVAPSPIKPSPQVSTRHPDGDDTHAPQDVPTPSTSPPVAEKNLSDRTSPTDEKLLLRLIAELQCDLSCRTRDLNVARAQIATLHSACDRRDEILRRIVVVAQPLVESLISETSSGRMPRPPSLPVLRELLCEAEATASATHNGNDAAVEPASLHTRASGSPGTVIASAHNSETTSWELAAQMLQGNVEELREANIALRVQVATTERSQQAAETLFRQQIDALRQQVVDASEHAAEHQRRKAEVAQVTKQVSVLQAALRDASLRESALQEQQHALQRILLLRDEEIAALSSRISEPELKPIASTQIFHAVGQTRYGPAFQRAATVLDVVSFRVGRILRGHAWIRVFVVVYLLILHLYTFHVVSAVAHDMPHVGDDVHDHLKNHMR